ncbi:patched domain-containing protein 3-like [Centruroides vittatus]|uniref:patched domain-containing protein 3-like n=1 Tax=Centruroides vittatus TaxID=120091 RepID=UPI00350FACB9
MYINVNRDLHYIYTAINGKAAQNREFTKSHFPVNTSYYADVQRISDQTTVSVAQIVAKDEGNLLRENIINEIIVLDSMIKNITVKWNENSANYNVLCGKKFSKCFESNVMKILLNYDDFITRKYKVKYPIILDEFVYTYEEYASSIGGMIIDKNGYLINFKAVRLLYLLDISDKRKENAIKNWKIAFNELLQSKQFNHISISFINDYVVDKEIQKFTDRLLLRLPIVFIIVVAFSLVTCMTNDWVKSKPWLGPSTCISATLAIVSGFGVMGFAGVTYVDFNIALCYVILGTEIDDSFVLIAAWRISDSRKSVCRRLGETYSETGVSITITSLTNFICFSIGISSPFPAFRSFCIYGCTWFLFTYLYQITFFGGCLALSGYREKKELHPFTFQKMKDSMEYQSETPDIYDTPDKNFLMEKFEVISFFLSLKSSKFLILMLFVVNISLGVYCLRYMKTGNDFSDIFSTNSMSAIYNNISYTYFSNYSYPLFIIIDKPINYADDNVYHDIEQFIEKVSSRPHVGSTDYLISWYKYFKILQKRQLISWFIKSYNMSKMEDFIEVLRFVFFKLPQSTEAHSDVVYNDNYTEIIATRFILPTADIKGQMDETELMIDLYKLAEESHLPVRFDNFMFPLLEQSTLIKGITLQSTVITSAIICVIFFGFVPNICCALCTALIVLCIICETVGFASFLGIKIDIVLLGCLIICIGFSINYPTHISFSFFMAKDTSPNKRLKKCLYDVGLPVFQGSFTTILGVCILPFEPYYCPGAFFKIIVIIALETAFHSLCVIPVILSLLGKFDKSLSVKVNAEFDNEFDSILQLTKA